MRDLLATPAFFEFRHPFCFHLGIHSLIPFCRRIRAKMEDGESIKAFNKGSASSKEAAIAKPIRCWSI
jgi:hypothetical protein